MPAPPQVSTQAIVNALLEWRGDVSAAARRLGMARNSLYERIQRLGLNLSAFRKADPSKPVTPITTVTGMPGMSGMSGNEPRDKDAQKKGRAIYPAAASGRRLGAVQQAETDEAPIKTAPERDEPIRLKPELRERLRRAVWKLQARYEAPTTVNLIVEQILEETVDGWVEAKLAPTAAAPKKSRNGKGEGGER